MSKWAKEEPCPVCQLGQRGGPIFRGGCATLPWSVYSSRRRQIAREHQTTSTLPVSAIEDSGAINPDEEVIRDITLVQPTVYAAVIIVSGLESSHGRRSRHQRSNSFITKYRHVWKCPEHCATSNFSPTAQGRATLSGCQFDRPRGAPVRKFLCHSKVHEWGSSTSWHHDIYT